MYYTTIPDTEHVHLLLFARYICLLPLLRYIPFHTYCAICPLFFLSAVMHLYATSFHLLRCCWHSFFSFFFFLKYPLSICCSSGPFSPQGSLKLHLVTSTPTLTFFPPPPRLIFLQTLPEVFLPRGSSFLTASLHCGVSILSLAQRKQYRRMEGRRLLRDLLWHSDADGLPPQKNTLFSTFHLLLVNSPLFAWWVQGGRS